jgi:acyl-coenzyme A synthetase/AMP-(fatty) acid ligase/acyl carrier protein
VLLAVTSLSFDIAALELLLPLTCGATVALAARDETVSGAKLLAALRRHGATVMQATPTSWELLLRAGWDGDPPLRALSGGEALTPHAARRLLAVAAEIWNLYGPTETTVWSTAWRLGDRDDVGAIGRPLPGTRVHVVDERLRPVPLGARGELLIGGPGLAHGYRGDPAATAERFVPDPFSGERGARLYRTGDVVRARAGGELEHLGRADDQVKVRGFRVELGEVEAALAGHPQVRAAVASVRERADGARELVAFVVPAGEPEPTAAALAEHAARTLPPYMVPSGFARIDAIPLTPSRKVDRRALPDPRTAALASGTRAERALSPLERTLAEVWGEVLGVEPAAPSDSFFDLGGHSLSALEVAWHLEQRLAWEGGLRALFETATLEQLAARAGAELGVA